MSVERRLPCPGTCPGMLAKLADRFAVAMAGWGSLPDGRRPTKLGVHETCPACGSQWVMKMRRSNPAPYQSHA